MRGVVLTGDQRAEVRDFADPEPGPGEVVVRMKASGLCGSDLHLYRQTSAQRAGNDTIPGHEPSGVVEAVGHGVTTVQVGDRVSVYHYRGCGHCRQCLAGNLMWCPERRGYGGPIHMVYDMAEFIVAHRLPLEKLVTHRFSIEEAPAAFALFDQGKTGKVILEWI